MKRSRFTEEQIAYALRLPGLDVTDGDLQVQAGQEGFLGDGRRGRIDLLVQHALHRRAHHALLQLREFRDRHGHGRHATQGQAFEGACGQDQVPGGRYAGQEVAAGGGGQGRTSVPCGRSVPRPIRPAEWTAPASRSTAPARHWLHRC